MFLSFSFTCRGICGSFFQSFAPLCLCSKSASDQWSSPAFLAGALSIQSSGSLIKLSQRALCIAMLPRRAAGAASLAGAGAAVTFFRDAWGRPDLFALAAASAEASEVLSTWASAAVPAVTLPAGAAAATVAPFRDLWRPGPKAFGTTSSAASSGSGAGRGALSNRRAPRPSLSSWVLVRLSFLSCIVLYASLHWSATAGLGRGGTQGTSALPAWSKVQPDAKRPATTKNHLRPRATRTRPMPEIRLAAFMLPRCIALSCE
mmetsp:Transcript_102270/g.305365  ORF Transcript_102270/g.305365 Transcript_102270/m.305365 type:complete len:261 (-) Transcript_102270:9-791(-)